METKAQERQGTPVSERTAEDWGRIAVGLPGLRWMPGMRDADGHIVIAVAEHSGVLLSATHLEGESHWQTPSKMAPPDIDDPATAGCLASMGYDAGWLVSVTRAQMYSGVVYIARYVGKGGRVQLSMVSPGRAIIAAAEARGGWL